MSRILPAMWTDMRVQFRNRLYAIGITFSVVLGAAVAQVARADQFYAAIPVTLLLVVGGSTVMYVAGMILFEKDEGTLKALVVSPLRVSEYLWSKVLTLTLLASLESAIMTATALALVGAARAAAIPNAAVLAAGTLAIAVLYTLFGIVLVVRYDKITEFLIPMAAVVGVWQLPALHFLGVVEHPVFLAIPTSAPTMIMRGAFQPLAAWEWAYGVGYSAAAIALFAVWAWRAFRKHIVMELR